jgi:hypothetical protein
MIVRAKVAWFVLCPYLIMGLGLATPIGGLVLGSVVAKGRERGFQKPMLALVQLPCSEAESCIRPESYKLYIYTLGSNSIKMRTIKRACSRSIVHIVILVKYPSFCIRSLEIRNLMKRLCRG